MQLSFEKLASAWSQVCMSNAQSHCTFFLNTSLFVDKALHGFCAYKPLLQLYCHI